LADRLSPLVTVEMEDERPPGRGERERAAVQAPEARLAGRELAVGK